ncbi:hypothetical protein KK137_11620 [Croceibacterium sp. LX-88]|uniref:Uncharacterized protein n=1 Tax=Croceibacterium selenioxidans TaxID=2838833 RepID=A0ABS5W6N9_9SPHN|nr:hypothetical protein [Croceibacterium selenioxidans]MBT2134983.1 hypothetical protein [Croceibacterium selenioxidans]
MLRTIRFAPFAAVALLAAAPAMAADSPVVGTWATEAVTDFGTFKSTLTVAEAADGYQVDIKDVPLEGAPPAPPSPPGSISDVVVDGSNFSFKRKLTTPQGEMQFSYTGTVDGDKLTAEVDTGQFGKIPVTGVRQ